MVWTLILCVLCLNRIKWWWGTKGQTTRVLLLTCYIQPITCYMCTLLVCYSQEPHETSLVTLLSHICKCQVDIELYYSINYWSSYNCYCHPMLIITTNLEENPDTVVCKNISWTLSPCKKSTLNSIKSMVLLSEGCIMPDSK